MHLGKKSLAMGIAALMLAAPVYAATPMGVSSGSDPYMVDLTKAGKKAAKQAKKQQKQKPQVVTPAAEDVKVNQVETSVVGGAAKVTVDSELKEDVPTGPRDERLVPYIGKRITKHIISGNNIVPEEVILSALKTKAGEEFTENGLAEDLSAIYSMGWFYDLRPEFNVVPEGVQVTYHVMENPTYQNLKISGNTVVSKPKAESCFATLERGQIANLAEINKCVQKFQEEYRSNGYILARVNDVHMEQDGTLNITVNEGNIEAFKVKGNKKCKDYVVTREMRMKVGQPFNAKLARRSMQRVYNLGYFEDVNIKLNPGKEPNAVEVEIAVVEQSTGTFGIGAGYSNADGFIGMVSIGDKNFRGIGDSVNLRWEFGGEDNRNYDFTYSRPWLDHKETRATINLYDQTYECADYDEDAHEIARYDRKRVGQELTFSRKSGHTDFISNYVTLKNRRDAYEGVDDDYKNDDQYYEDSFKPGNPKWKNWYPATALERRKENFGTTRSITLGRVYDSRDNIHDPHEGKRIAYSFEWAGFGGDFDFRKWTADWRYYYRAGKHNPVNTWAWNFVAGYADGDMPLSQRFTMGGTDTLRGYEDDQFRGNSMLKATLEYRFPIVKKIQGVLFTDNGYAWDKRHEDHFDISKIKTSVGAGLRINSPLGPVKLDYGWGDEGGKFHFSFGGQF